MIKMAKKQSHQQKLRIKVVDLDDQTTYIDGIEEAARIFECTPTAIYVALRRGHIRGCKISKE